LPDEEFHKALAESIDPKNRVKGNTESDIIGSQLKGHDDVLAQYERVNGKLPSEFLERFRTSEAYKELTDAIDKFNAANINAGDNFLKLKNKCAIEYAFDPPPPAEKEPECEKSYKKALGMAAQFKVTEKDGGTFKLSENKKGADGKHETGVREKFELLYGISMKERPFGLVAEGQCVIDYVVDASAIERSTQIDIQGGGSFGVQQDCLSFGFRAQVCYDAGKEICGVFDQMAQNIDTLIGYKEQVDDGKGGLTEKTVGKALKYWSTDRAHY